MGEAEDLADESYLTYDPRTVTVVEETNAIAEIVAVDARISILSRWALAPLIDSARIVEVRCGAAGLPLAWHALLRPTEPEGSPARLIADELAHHLDDFILDSG